MRAELWLGILSLGLSPIHKVVKCSQKWSRKSPKTVETVEDVFFFNPLFTKTGGGISKKIGGPPLVEAVSSPFHIFQNCPSSPEEVSIGQSCFLYRSSLAWDLRRRWAGTHSVNDGFSSTCLMNITWLYNQIYIYICIYSTHWYLICMFICAIHKRMRRWIWSSYSDVKDSYEESTGDLEMVGGL